jgi:hypothetical protein
MKPMIRRLRELERRSLFSAEDEGGSELVAMLQARRTRRLQMPGDCTPVKTRQRQHSVACERTGWLTIADVLRNGRYGVSHGRAEDSTR